MGDVQRQRRRRVRGALIGSLALNLVFIGLLAGAAYRQAGGPGAGERAGGPGARNYATAYVRALPQDARRALFRSVRDGNETMPGRSERRALYDAVLVALRAEPFDPDAVAALVRRQGQVALAFQTASEGAWLAQVAQMTAAERDAYADRVAEILRRGPRRRDTPERD